MKVIFAYIQPFMLEKVADALRKRHVHGMTVLECKGFGRQTEGNKPHYLDKDVRIDFAHKVKIEIVCGNGDADGIVETIREHAHTGRHGDGKIFVLDVNTAVDIQDGRTGDEVL
ncbi:MAG: P-II family nitrogen regulator [Planctomycetota bacterium]